MMKSNHKLRRNPMARDKTCGAGLTFLRQERGSFSSTPKSISRYQKGSSSSSKTSGGYRSTTRTSRPINQVWRRQPRNTYRKKPRSWKNVKKGLQYGFCIFSAMTILAGFSLLLVSGYQYVLTMPYFCIKDRSHIQIEGLRRVTPAQVLEAAHLAPGMSLLAIHPYKVEKTLNQHPWIKQAVLIRQWPDRIHLVIQEYQPVAIVHLDTFYYFDRNGVLFKPLDPQDSPDLPVITGLKASHFEAEGGITPLLTRLIQTLEFLKACPPPFNLANIAEIHVDPEQGFTFYPIGLGFEVELGFQEYHQKFANLHRLLPALEKSGDIQRVARINLNYADRVLVSLKKPESASP